MQPRATQILTPSLITTSGIAVGVDLVVPILVVFVHYSRHSSSCCSAVADDAATSKRRMILVLLMILLLLVLKSMVYDCWSAARSAFKHFTSLINLGKKDALEQ